MRMTDIVSFMDLDVFPILAMILFLAAFGLILWTVVRTPRSVSNYQARLPLDDAEINPSNAHDPKGVSHV